MPRITRVTVGASRKFNDPIESYANHSASVTLDAEVPEGEDHATAIRILQNSAKVFVDAEHDRIVAAAKAEYEAELERCRQERKARQSAFHSSVSISDDEEEHEDMPF